MSDLMDSVDLRTQLVGENRLEILMFRLHGDQLFAINVFKVQEVQQMPKLTLVPQRHPIVVGVTHVRGQTIPVIDLSKAINMEPMDDYSKCNIIISEYNMSIQAFMVRSVDRIVNLTWDKISSPPKGTGRGHFLTAITRLDDQLVEVIDVEKVLTQIKAFETEVSEEVKNQELLDFAKGMRILIADDSSVARSQLVGTFEALGLIVDVMEDGKQAWEHLLSLKKQGVDIPYYYLMMVTDAEMPEMDGYRLTHNCREDEKIQDLYIILHTSLSGEFNQSMCEKVGCNGLISKFQPDNLARVLQERIQMVKDAQDELS